MKNTSLFSPLIEKAVHLVEVQFHQRERGFGGKSYTYKCDLHFVAVDDIVLCETGAWFSVAKVTNLGLSIPLDDEESTYRWIVCKLDLSAHDDRLAREQRLIETLQRKRLDAMRNSALAALGIDRDEVLLEVDKPLAAD